MLNKGENGRANDLDSLMRVKDLSWLSGSEMTGLASGLVMCSFKKHEVILTKAVWRPRVIVECCGSAGHDRRLPFGWLSLE
jgi:hypothetical protein